jgi:uncharacterized protein YecE (DUF72 family)
MLAHYAAHFDSVEVNNLFYRLARPEAVAAWRDATPGPFLFAVKASRYLTHMKKLLDPAPGLARFLLVAEALGPKLGPILFQLPPRFGCNPGRLEAFLQALPPAHRYVFELRDTTWHTEEVYGILARHRAAFCVWDLAGVRAPPRVTTDFVYVRLHGPGGKYQGSYSRAQLRRWARQAQAWAAELGDVYIYFDNDQAGYAALNARVLRELLG